MSVEVESADLFVEVEELGDRDRPRVESLQAILKTDVVIAIPRKPRHRADAEGVHVRRPDVAASAGRIGHRVVPEGDWDNRVKPLGRILPTCGKATPAVVAGSGVATKNGIAVNC